MLLSSGSGRGDCGELGTALEGRLVLVPKGTDNSGGVVEEAESGDRGQAIRSSLSAVAVVLGEVCQQYGKLDPAGRLRHSAVPA